MIIIANIIKTLSFQKKLKLTYNVAKLYKIRQQETGVIEVEQNKVYFLNRNPDLKRQNIFDFESKSKILNYNLEK